jgi:hypothetical protein
MHRVFASDGRTGRYQGIAHQIGRAIGPGLLQRGKSIGHIGSPETICQCMPSHCEWNGSQGWAADRTLRSQNELMWTTVIMYPTGTRSWTQSHCVKSKDTIFCVLLETNLGLLASPSIELGNVFNEKCQRFHIGRM